MADEPPPSSFDAMSAKDSVSPRGEASLSVESDRRSDNEEEWLLKRDHHPEEDWTPQSSREIEDETSVSTHSPEPADGSACQDERFCIFKQKIRAIALLRWKHQSQRLRKEVQAKLAQEVDEPVPDISLVRDLCLRLGTNVPEELRASVWRVLLDVSERAEGGSGLFQDLSTVANAEVLHEECLMASHSIAGSIGESSRAEMEMILSLYCSRKSMHYPTGLANIVAPFFLLGLPLLTLFDCIFKFIALLNHTSHSQPVPQESFTPSHDVLAAKRRLFRVLLYYHAPRLARHLDDQWKEWELDPNCIPDEWLGTYFAGSIPPSAVLSLFQQILVTKDLELGSFVALSAIQALEDELIQGQGDGIRGTMGVRLSELFDNEGFMDYCCRQSRILKQRTPSMFYRLAEEARIGEGLSISFGEAEDNEEGVGRWQWTRVESKTYAGKHYWYNSKTHATQWDSPFQPRTAEDVPTFCLPIIAEEALEWLSGNGGRPCLVFDCRAVRSSDDMFVGRLPNTVPIDPSYWESPEKLEEVVKEVEDCQDRYRAILLLHHGIPWPSSGCLKDLSSSEAELSLIAQKKQLGKLSLFLQRKQIKYVCYVSGGFAACHSVLSTYESHGLDVLAAHVPSKCRLCLQQRHAGDSKSAFGTDVSGYRASWSGISSRIRRPSLPQVTQLIPEARKAALMSKKVVGSGISFLKAKTASKATARPSSGSNANVPPSPPVNNKEPSPGLRDRSADAVGQLGHTTPEPAERTRLGRAWSLTLAVQTGSEKEKTPDAEQVKPKFNYYHWRASEGQSRKDLTPEVEEEVFSKNACI